MTIRARYPGRCVKCGGRINPGDQIHWDPNTKATEHTECPEQIEEPTATKTYSIGGGSGYGCRGWKRGDVVRANKRQREKGYPEWLYVLSSDSRYYRYDGLSFGVGDDSGYCYSAVCREATPEEAAPYIAKLEAARKRRAAQTRVEKIKWDIRECGTMPEASDDNARGERLFDTQNIYGGGDWFVVNETELWYVQNNGMDGDCWARNNVTTGGAGAIGWVIPRDDALVTELHELAELLGSEK